MTNTTSKIAESVVKVCKYCIRVTINRDSSVIKGFVISRVGIIVVALCTSKEESDSEVRTKFS